MRSVFDNLLGRKFPNEQAENPESIEFCYQIGLDTVSCSPYRIPVARLSAAQATLKYKEIDPKYGKIYPQPKDLFHFEK